MIQSFDIQTFLKLSRANPVLDVRSPAEFSYACVPGAINLPLFSNEERSEVGTIYKQQGKEAAIKKGLDFVGPRMRSLVEFAESVPFTDMLLLHCWRGGMRSQSVAWLLKTYGLPVATLEGGYKAFRNFALSYFEQTLQLRVISGPTGSGKTELLHALRKAGEQVLDLEGLAHHKGSVFGELGQQQQPSSEQFQNLIFWELKEFDLKRPVWIEDESIGIGKVMIPLPLWKQMGTASRAYVNLNKALRIKRLCREYGSFPRQVLQNKIIQLEKKLGGQHLQSILKDLSEDRLEKVAEQLLVYYDKAYGNSVQRHQGRILANIDANHECYDEWAQLLIKQMNRQYDRTGKVNSV